MEKLVDSVQQLLVAAWDVVWAMSALLIPWVPLFAWIAFWLLAVNWEKLYPVLAKGGFIGVALIGLTTILIWGLIAPPAEGVHHLLGLNPTNFVGKAVYVSMLFTITAMCGTVQLSGVLGSYFRFPDADSESISHESFGVRDRELAMHHHNSSIR